MTKPGQEEQLRKEEGEDPRKDGSSTESGIGQPQGSGPGVAGKPSRGQVSQAEAVNREDSDGLEIIRTAETCHLLHHLYTQVWQRSSSPSPTYKVRRSN